MFVLSKNGKEKGVYAKMARGAMVRYLAENKIEDIKDITSFNELDYVFDASQSTEKLYTFQKSYRHDSFSNNSTTICVCSLYVVYALSSLFKMISIKSLHSYNM